PSRQRGRDRAMESGDSAGENLDGDAGRFRGRSPPAWSGREDPGSNNFSSLGKVVKSGRVNILRKGCNVPPADWLSQQKRFARRETLPPPAWFNPGDEQEASPISAIVVGCNQTCSTTHCPASICPAGCVPPCAEVGRDGSWTSVEYEARITFSPTEKRKP